MINRWISPGRQSLRDAIEQMFEDPFFRRSLSGSRTRTLSEEQLVPVNIFELPEGLMVVAPMPGLQPEDVDISVSDNVLTLRGNRSPGQEDREYTLKEWNYGPYYRNIDLPFPVDMDHVIATLNNGVLTVNLRKSPSAMPRRIQVRTAANQSIVGGETHRSEPGHEKEEQAGVGTGSQDMDRQGNQ